MSQERLSSRLEKNVFVGNIGKSGNNTREHYYQLQYLLDQYPDIDMVILLAGVSDLHLKISDPNFSRMDFDSPERVSEVIDRAFAAEPSRRYDSSLPFYERTSVWQLLMNRDNDSETENLIQDNAGQWYVQVREALI